MKRRVFLFWASTIGMPSFAQPAQRRTIGYLSPRSKSVESDLLAALLKGISETGFAEGRNVLIEYRWADGKYDRLPGLAVELRSRGVEAIVTSGGPQVARAARAANPDTPMVFISGSDPVHDGLVKSLNHPEGNTTGVVSFTTSLGPKRLELLRELMPKPGEVAFLVNPKSQVAAVQVEEVREAARIVDQPLHVLHASTPAELERAFGTAAQRRAGGVLMAADLFFQVQREQLVGLAMRHAIPVMYEWREFVVSGGLVSYSSRRTEDWRQAGVRVGRILNGAKPSELPIGRSTKFELVLNAGTARSLGLAVPPAFLARVDEVVE